MTARLGRPTCYLHLGPPKTGSSTISHFIEGNLAELDRLGYFVPHMPSLEGRPRNGHGIFANVVVNEVGEDGALLPGAELWPELEAVAAKGEKNIILTNEAFAFSLRVPRKLDRILKFFERHGYGVTVIAYLRDQPGSLNSSYVQTQKRLYARQTFEEFVEECADNGRVDPWRLLELIIDNPRVSLSAGSFEAAYRGGLEADFARRIGLPPDAKMEPVPEVRNPNAGAKTVYAAQQILARTEGVIHKMGLYKRIYRRFRKHFENSGWTDDPYVGLDQDSYERIRAYYRDSNERFARRFLGADWAELVQERSYVKNVFDPASASKDELAEVNAVVDEVVGLIQNAQRLKALREKPKRLFSFKLGAAAKPKAAAKNKGGGKGKGKKKRGSNAGGSGPGSAAA
ncbi:hypothetical protein [Methylopila sp. M107]|uniref:hypothetical protein n=1 Tax=Methylopila sp. M107 TaxID=1101190 RepID=UPI000382D5DF|nr:hypothetical protein [Methylopila sp. M107]